MKRKRKIDDDLADRHDSFCKSRQGKACDCGVDEIKRGGSPV